MKTSSVIYFCEVKRGNLGPKAAAAIRLVPIIKAVTSST